MKAISVVREALDDVKIIDPHCHLRPEKPSADNLADILLYHHLWIELISSGMDQFEVTKSGFPHELVDPEIPPLERVKRAVQYLPCIRNTTVGLFFRWIMKDLFNMEDALGERNIEKIFIMLVNDVRIRYGRIKYCGITAGLNTILLSILIPFPPQRECCKVKRGYRSISSVNI